MIPAEIMPAMFDGGGIEQFQFAPLQLVQGFTGRHAAGQDYLALERLDQLKGVLGPKTRTRASGRRSAINSSKV